MATGVDGPRVPGNTFWDAGLHGIAADIKTIAPAKEQAARVLADQDAPSAVGRVFNWMSLGLAAPPPPTANQIRAKRLKKTRKRVEKLEVKLAQLENKAYKIDAQLRAHPDNPAYQGKYEPKLLAIKGLLVDVRMEIVRGAREEYELLYEDDPDTLAAKREEIRTLEEVYEAEAETVLVETARWESVYRIFDDIRNMRADSKAAKPINVRKVERLRDRLLEKYEIDPKKVRRFQEGLSVERQDALILRQQEAVVNVFLATINASELEDVRVPLTDKEVAVLKESNLKEQIVREHARLNVHEGRLARLEKSLASLRGDISNKGVYLDDLRKELNEDYLEDVRVNELNAPLVENADGSLSGGLILVAEAELAALEEQEAPIRAERQQVSKDIVAVSKNIKQLEARLRAQQDVNKLVMGKGSRLGSLLSRAIDAAARVSSVVVGDKESKYKWEKKDWGKLLAPEGDGTFKSFRDSIAVLKKEAKEMDARIEVMGAQRTETKRRLDANEFLESKYSVEEGGLGGEAVKEAWQAQVRQLDDAIRDTLAARQDTKISIRAAFLQRIITGVGQRRQQVNGLQADIAGKEAYLEDLRQQLDALRAEPDSEKRNRDIDRHEAEVAGKVLEVNQLKRKVADLETEIEALGVGFDEQMGKYERLERLERPFMEQLKNYATDRITEMVSLGFISNQYRTPRDLKVEMDFARHGYNWVDGLKGFASEPVADIPTFVTQQVGDFLKFADDYPQLAEVMLADVAVTVSRLGGDDALQTLLKGVRTRAMVRALQGEAGRNVEALPELTEENYAAAAKWRAFADLAQYGPVAAATPAVLGAAFEGFASGGIVGLLTRGAVAGVKEGGTNVVLQQVVRSVRPEDLQVVTGILSAVNGASMQEIVDEQRNIAVMQLVGNARRTISKPGLVLRGIRRAFSNQWNAFKMAGWGERILRVGVIVVAPPVITAGVVAAGILLLNPAGLLAIGGIALVGLVAGVTIPTMAMTFMNNIWPFSSTMKAAKKNQARELLEKNRNELRRQRDTYIQHMEAKGILVQSLTSSEIPKLHEGLSTACFEPFGDLQQRLLEQLNTGLHEREENNQATNLSIVPKDVREVFVAVARPETLRTTVQVEVTRIIAASDLDPAPTQEEKDTFVRVYTALIAQQLKDQWLRRHLDEAMASEFEVIAAQYDSPEQFEANIERLRQRNAGKVRDAKADLQTKINAEIDDDAQRSRVYQQCLTDFELDVKIPGPPPAVVG